MPITNWAPFQILAGPADVYVGEPGATFPAIDEAPGVAWTSLGETEGGVTVRHTQSVELLTTDQHIAALKAIRSEEGLEIEFSLAELTLEHYAIAMGAVSGVDTSEAGQRKIGLTRGVEPDLKSLLIRDRSPYENAFAQYEVPVVVQTDEPEVEHVKDDKSVLACTFTAMADLTASDPDELFGRLIAADSTVS